MKEYILFMKSSLEQDSSAGIDLKLKLIEDKLPIFKDKAEMALIALSYSAEISLMPESLT